MTKTRIETIKFLPHDPSQSGLSEKSFDISYDDETGLYSTEEVNKSRLSTPKSPFKDSNKLHLPKNFKILPKELSLKELSISLENSQLGKFEAGTELDTVETHVNQHKEVDQKIRESVVHPNPPETLDLDKYRFFYNEDDNTEPMISDNKMITSLDPANPKEAIERLNARNLFSLNDEETKLKSKPVTTTDELLEPVKSFFPADLQFLTAKINEEAQNVDYKQKLKDAILIIIDTQVSRTLKSITQRPEDKKINDLSLIVVNAGPGGTNSVRSGVSFANSLGFSLKIPVSYYNSFEVIGRLAWQKFNTPDDGDNVVAKSRRGRSLRS